jgi:hypothetical protein
VNLGWHPAAEALLWTPEWQEAKTSEQGGDNVRYRAGLKGRLVRELTALRRGAAPLLPRAIRVLTRSRQASTRRAPGQARR